MHRKTRGWLRKMRELGWSRHGFGSWMSGSEMIVQRGLGHDQSAVMQTSLVQEDRKIKANMDQRNNVIPMQPRKTIPTVRTLPATPLANLETDLWELRKQLVIQIAKRRNGKVRLQEVAAECNVNIRIAAEWLKRLSLEGMLSVVAGHRNVMVYSVKE
jgi:hypothetical protein